MYIVYPDPMHLLLPRSNSFMDPQSYLPPNVMSSFYICLFIYLVNTLSPIVLFVYA